MMTLRSWPDFRPRVVCTNHGGETFGGRVSVLLMGDTFRQEWSERCLWTLRARAPGATLWR